MGFFKALTVKIFDTNSLLTVYRQVQSTGTSPVLMASARHSGAFSHAVSFWHLPRGKD